MVINWNSNVNILIFWDTDFWLSWAVSSNHQMFVVKCFTLHAMNLKYMKVLLFEITYKKKWTFSRHSNLLCTCMWAQVIWSRPIFQLLSSLFCWPILGSFLLLRPFGNYYQELTTMQQRCIKNLTFCAFNLKKNSMHIILVNHITLQSCSAWIHTWHKLWSTSSVLSSLSLHPDKRWYQLKEQYSARCNQSWW